MCVCVCVCVCVRACVYVCVCVCVVCLVILFVRFHSSSLTSPPSLPGHIANKKLSDMTAELSKAQEHARRFQDLLTAERRKQKSLKVNKKDTHFCSYIPIMQTVM